MTAPIGLPVSTLRNMFISWVNVININESASVLNISKWSQTYRIEQFLQDKEFLAKNVRDYGNIGFVKIDPNFFPFDNFKGFDRYLKSIIGKDKKSHVILVTNADYLITKYHDILGYINSYAINNVNTSFIFFFEKNITLPEIFRTIDSYPVLLQNIITNPPYASTDIDTFIRYKEKSFGSTIPEALVKKIKLLCGNRLGLITQAIRYYSLTRDEKSVFDHDEINLKVKLIWDEFEASEKKLLEKIVKKEYDFSAEENDMINHFLKTRLLEKSKKNIYKITIPLLVRFMEKTLVKKAVIAADSGKKIVINDVVVDEFFSRRERKLIRRLMAEKNKTVKRERVGEMLWGEEPYTDWALDQAIRRLRNKFFKLGLPKDIIATRKNSGFVFNV